MKRILSTFFLMISLSMLCTAQTLHLDADMRSRFEYRHGYGNLFVDDAKPASFVIQRSRLNTGYFSENLKVMLSIQDVSTWGDTRQLDPSDANNSLSLFQAWAEVGVLDKLSVKLGRQVISYDDQRIFGGVDWAMQGRFHDALLLKYKNDGFSMDVGLAFSQEEETLIGSRYDITGFYTYKTMQYLYAHKTFQKLQLSFLFLNNGFQKYEDEERSIADGVYDRQTTGFYFQYPLSKWKFSGSFYYQFGKASPEIDLSAYQFAFNGEYAMTAGILGAGIEILSGTDMQGNSDNHSFFPLYGTNHKFNGFMDYFYVGNHADNVGLNDIYAKYLFKFPGSTLLLKGHYFTSNADLSLGESHYLGTEFDLVFGKEIVKNVFLNVGYSHMFPSDSMQTVKGGISPDNTNNWAWVQLKITPKLLRFSMAD
ncbi:alginate export family protein [Sinomicrobium sp. M5D2P17]